MDADVIVVGAGNAGDVGGAGGARAGRVGARAGEGARASGRAATRRSRRARCGSRTTASTSLRDVLEDDPRLDATDLPPYTRRGVRGRHAAGHARARRRGDGARAGRRLRRTRSAGCTRRGIRFRLMYERQSYEADGRHRFWGGLAVGVVDGGRGLIDQHAAAAEAHGIEVRHDAPVEELVDGGVRPAPTAPRDAARARGRAGGGRLRVQPADARGAPRTELGRGEGPRHAAQHRRGAARGAASRRAAVRELERLPRDPVGPRRARRPAIWS